MQMQCVKCGVMFDDASADWMARASQEVADRYRSRFALCPEHAAAASRQSEADARNAAETELKSRLREHLREHIKESQLDLYRLDYDPAHPSANRALMSWMMQHVDTCVWLIGESGTGKTRVIQEAARIAVRDRSVRYWPVADLAARLLETAKKPEATLWDTYGADLLILDDLGKETLTAARVAAIEAIVDHRYIGWDQVRRKQGADEPRFGLYTGGGRLGGQLWITSQVSPEIIVERLSAVNQGDAAAIVRRLSEMCVVHQAETVR